MPSGTAACECLPLHHAVFVRDPFLPIKQLVKERLGMTARPINYHLRPNACSSRDQWCDEAQASMPTRQGGSFSKNART